MEEGEDNPGDRTPGEIIMGIKSRRIAKAMRFWAKTAGHYSLIIKPKDIRDYDQLHYETSARILKEDKFVPNRKYLRYKITFP